MDKNQFKGEHVQGLPNVNTATEPQIAEAQRDLRDMGKRGLARRLRNKWLRVQHMNSVLLRAVA